MVPTTSRLGQQLLFLLLAGRALADGTGLIGYGKTMYHPPCAFACRGVVRVSQLSCTPVEGGELHGPGHSMTPTPPECYVSDPAFLRTMALCIATHCPHGDGGMPPLSLLEDYWRHHLGTGTVGTPAYTPAMSYVEALREAEQDVLDAGGEVDVPSNETAHDDHAGMDHSRVKLRLRVRQHEGHGEEEEEEEEEEMEMENGLPTLTRGDPLNSTHLVAMEDWQLQYNGMTSFEINETGHSTYTIAITLVALFLPVLLSMLRFVPFLRTSSTWVWLNSMLSTPPAWGSRHREPVAPLAGGGLVPTRGQALYVALLSVLNVVFLVAPYYNIQPQSTFASLRIQEISLIGNRAGSMAMGNVVAMFVFSTRNNVLLWLTDWSHGTFLLLHRWLGYWAILLTALHSVMLLYYYVTFGDYAYELSRDYWVWGIVSTVAACAILPASLLVVRQRFYQSFLAAHQLLALIFLIGYYYHIWYCYNYNWGYEIWMFVASGIWAFEYVIRIARMAFNRFRTAVVSPVEGSNGEYMRVTIDGVSAHGVVYLCFPTLTWAFWETHPYSVASSYAYDVNPTSLGFEKHAYTDEPAKTTRGDVIEKAEDKSSGASSPKLSASSAVASRGVISHVNARPQATFLVRTRAGFTSSLAARLAKSTSGSIRLPVLVDGSYHSAPLAQLHHCTSIVCIAGGVGITTVLPLLQANGQRPAKLFWGLRHDSLLREVADLLDALPAGVLTQTSVGDRLDIEAILNEELLRVDEKPGTVGIVVSGPPGMADKVRTVVSELGATGLSREFILVDEGFSW
ncbi:hypothetical protein S40288_10124 [Stachybotrys chartarum IBT 40288]|nr:hypothetical protein S40288_10124 [Stachybotrys chartarum IBT 40288]